MSTANPLHTASVRPDAIRVEGRDVPIGVRGLVIGRRSDCDIVVDSETVSREHARVFINAEGCWIQDRSKNGTTINGVPIEGTERLASGDRVGIGDAELVALGGETTGFGIRRESGAPAGSSTPTAVQLSSRPLTIGRDPSNVVGLDDPNVSRFHAVIEQRDGGSELRDLSSRNGTRVNGKLVWRVPLDPGDEVAIGAYRFRFTGVALSPVDDRKAVRLESRDVRVNVGNAQLLAPTSLVVEPGELVAIIGESGAGKTTLLKALAGITRPTGGEVLINSEPVMNRLTDVGYVPQDDIVHRLLTVREALRYAARLRLPPDTSAAEVESAVERVLGELELTARADVRVDRLSGGQRKRVGVAVELLSRPGILFLDEPATGLDPWLEKRLMELLRRLSHEGRPIVTITHSTKHLRLCDKLAVMGRGGVLCYYGPPAGALEQFGVSDYDDIYAVMDTRPTETWEVSLRRQEGRERGSGVFAGSLPSAVAADRQPPVLPQARVLAQRYLTLMLRDRRNLAILLGQVPVLALAIAIGFKPGLFSRATTRINAPTFLFVATITAMWLGAIASAREIVKEKSVFLRERAVGVSVRAYLLSKLAVLGALCATQTLILVTILFGLRPLHGQGSAYIAVVVILLLTSFAAVGMGLLISTLARSEDQATSFIPLILIPQLLFGGSIITLVGKGIGFKLLAALMLARWSFAGLGASAGLRDSQAVVVHYGPLFSHPVALLLFIVACFTAVTVGLVAVRLGAERS